MGKFMFSASSELRCEVARKIRQNTHRLLGEVDLIDKIVSLSLVNLGCSFLLSLLTVSTLDVQATCSRLGEL